MNKLKVTLPILLRKANIGAITPTQQPLLGIVSLGLVAVLLASSYYLYLRQIAKPNQLFERIVLAATATTPLLIDDVNQATLAAQHTEKIHQQLVSEFNSIDGIDAAIHSQALLASASDFLYNEQGFTAWINAQLQLLRQDSSDWLMNNASFNERHIQAGESCLVLTHQATGWQLSAIVDCAEGN